MAKLLGWIASLLGSSVVGSLGSVGLSLAKDVVDAYAKRIDAATSADANTTELVKSEIAAQQREMELLADLRRAQIGKWYEPEHLFAYIVVVYFGKIIIFDKVLGLGSTDPLTGDVAQWAALIVAFLFGKRGFENVARIIALRKK